MVKQAVATISYFSDVLCVWAYVAQIKLDEMRRQFGDQIRVEYHFLPLFGDVAARIAAGWSEKNGVVGYRIIEANIQELLAEPSERASWC